MLGSFVDWQLTPPRFHFHEINESQTYVFPQIPRKLVQMQIPRHHPCKNWLIGKEPDAEKDWRQEEKGTREDEMIGWHHRLDGHGFEQASGVGDGQGSLACCCPWGCKESDNTEQPNWLTDFIWTSFSPMKSFSPHLINKKLRFRELKWFIQVLRLTLLIPSPPVLTVAITELVSLWDRLCAYRTVMSPSWEY